MLTTEQAQAATHRLSQKLAHRAIEADKLDDAYRGTQPLKFASEKWREYNANRYKDFSDNWCGVVGNSPAERLRINGFDLNDDAATDGQSTGEKLLWNWWDRNDLDEQSSQGLLSSIIAKRSNVLVWGDENDDPTITWEHGSQTIVEYDPANPRRRRTGLKQWTDGDFDYATLYEPDAVWKWQRSKSRAAAVRQRVVDAGLTIVGTVGATEGRPETEWQPRQPDGDDTWPIPNPLGEVPLVEFPNRPMLAGEPLSDIDGTLAMQDAINLLWAYLFNAADFASMPARVVMGQEPPKVPILDENGQKIGEKDVPLKKLAEDRIMWLTGQKTSIGQWDAAKLDVFTDVIEVAVGHIAAQTRTPQHYLVGKMANLSADALKAAETGLTKKVAEQQLFFGPAAREVFRLTALAADQPGLAEQCRTGRVLWQDAESRSDAQSVDAATKDIANGLPLAYVLERRYGLGPSDIARVLKMKRDEQAELLAAGLAPIVTPGAPADPLEPDPSPDAAA